MAKRLQSPSSINTYLQCPRKYYFLYHLKMPTSPSIHLVRGSVAHLALEHLYQLLPEVISENHRENLKVIIVELLKKFWKEHQEEFNELNMNEQEIQSYFEETKGMLINYINQFSDKVDAQMSRGLDFPEAFRKLTPEVEKEYRSDDYSVRGFIDVIENHDGIVRLMDYKTSKRAHITDAYKLQLAIYALLYELEHGNKPDEVGIYFLKEGEQVLPVNEELVKHAQFYIEQIHASTESDHIDDYPMKTSPLCKWSSGQCDFYEYCFRGKDIPKEPLKRVYKEPKSDSNKSF
ncbi:MAG: PD-(D/E)XK nuclease family protein [Nanoarchaeota archaeon]|nr:PD-(D/E)XK nuclease family protein [Nanoarchaeota archaeon]